MSRAAVSDQVPRLACLSCEKLGSVAIIGELFSLRVPVQLLARFEGNVAEVRDRRRAVAGLHFRSRRVSRAHAVDEILRMQARRVGGVQLVALERFFD
jgi:hypothetical protein